MIRVTIYRKNETIEVESENPELAKMQSGKICYFDRTLYSKGEVEGPDNLLRIRPYYRRTIDGVLNIFAEEELSND